MNTFDNPYNIFPTSQYVVKMVHLHPYNSSKEQRRKSPMRSILKVWRKPANNQHEWLSKEIEKQFKPDLVVEARCRPGDTPSRSKAREILRLKAQTAKDLLGWA